MSASTKFRAAWVSATLIVALSLVERAASDTEESQVDLTLTDVAPTLTNSLGMKLVKVRAGRFTMGSAKGEPGRRDDEGPSHEVRITKDFWLGAYEVTQAEFRAVMGYNPSYFSADGKAKGNEAYAHAPGGGKDKVKDLDVSRFPVENVAWSDAQLFLAKLNARDEEKKFGLTYRLPTEAEWEYAARGGPSSSSKPFHAGAPSDSLSSTQANFNGNSPAGGADKGPFLNRTCKVGSYPPNRLGLYDLHGNVWEWCEDWLDVSYYAASPRDDPTGPAKGYVRAMRGGCWLIAGANLRVGGRGRSGPEARVNFLGFRVAASPKK